MGDPAAETTRELDITVQVLQAPQASIAVSGAAGSGGNYTAVAGDNLTFDSGGSTGAIETWTWRDDATGNTLQGPVWNTALQQPGPHRITLTVDHSVMGSDTAEVTVTITARDATAPVVETPWTLFYGPTYQAEARSTRPGDRHRQHRALRLDLRRLPEQRHGGGQLQHRRRRSHLPWHDGQRAGHRQ